MAWIPVSYRLTSSAPMLQHNGQTADPLNRWAKALKQISSKRKKTDSDFEEMARIEFMAGLYLGPDGPIIPPNVIDGAVKEAAKKSREGRTAPAACYCLDPATLEYDGARDPAELWSDDRFRFSAIVRVQSARVCRMRPIFSEWAATVKLMMEDTVINVSKLDDWMYIAGTQVGIGDWRPQYGRFTAERLNGE